MPDQEQNSDFDSLFEDGGYVSRSEAKRLARDEVSKTLRDINSFASQAQAGVTNAIHEVSSVHPDFQTQRSRMLTTLEELPILREAISAAESNPQLAPTLPQLYEIAYRAAQASSENTTTKPASEPKLEGQGDLSDESAQYRAALASQQVSLAPENRKSLIADLEKRGVLDIEF